MNVGAVALVTGGALLMHAALTAQSPLADLQSIFASGKVAAINGLGSNTINPITGNQDSLIKGTPGTGGSPGGQPSGPDPLPSTNHVTPSGTVH